MVATGRAGHGSQFVPDTATSKLLAMVQRLLALREEEERRLHVSFGAEGHGKQWEAKRKIPTIIPLLKKLQSL